MFSKMSDLPITDKVWPSHANFLLVRFHNLARVHKRLAQERILIRHFRNEAALEGCVRITIGSAEENQRLVRALGSLGPLYNFLSTAE